MSFIHSLEQCKREMEIARYFFRLPFYLSRRVTRIDSFQQVNSVKSRCFFIKEERARVSFGADGHRNAVATAYMYNGHVALLSGIHYSVCPGERVSRTRAIHEYQMTFRNDTTTTTL